MLESSYKFPHHEIRIYSQYFYFPKFRIKHSELRYPFLTKCKNSGPLFVKKKSFIYLLCCNTLCQLVQFRIPALKNWIVSLLADGKSASCLKVSWNGRLLLAKKESKAWDFPVGRKLVVKVGALPSLKTPPMKGLVTRGYDGFFDWNSNVSRSFKGFKKAIYPCSISSNTSHQRPQRQAWQQSPHRDRCALGHPSAASRDSWPKVSFRGFWHAALDYPVLGIQNV